MTHDYTITGMTCGKCVAKVKGELLKTGDVISADINLDAGRARIGMLNHVSTRKLQEAVSRAGGYVIVENEGQLPAGGMVHGETVVNGFASGTAPEYGIDGNMAGRNAEEASGPQSGDETVSYRPLLLILGYLLLVTFLVQWKGGFSLMGAMQVFMGGFFLVFSFFKLMDLRGFAEGYSSYDLVARIFPGWGFIYPFAELLLAIAFITGFEPMLTNIVTLVIMGVSSIGVIRSLMSGKQIRCACLGTAIRLPLGKVTLTEDLLMVLMTGFMILLETGIA